MTQGLSGTYAVQGVDFQLQPTSGRWLKREEYGIDGGAHPIYPADRDFEVVFGLMSPADVKQLIDAYNVVGNTGTVAFDLPEYGANAYQFKTYSGTTLQEPEVGESFMGYWQDVRLLIIGIRT